MPRELVKIDLIIHREGADAMVHSARTDFNIALAPTTARFSLEPLAATRSLIEGSLLNNTKVTPQDLQNYGDQLANVLFAGPVGLLYQRSGNGTDLQLSLCTGDAILKSIPWEFVRWPDLQSAPHRSRTMARLIPATTTQPLFPLPIDGGIRVLLAVSQPTDQPAVEWVETAAAMRNTFEVATPKIRGRAVELRIEETVSATSMRRAVGEFDPHIVHFIGHGAPTGLWFTKHQAANGQLVPSGSLHSTLTSESTRLVILSACDTANVDGKISSLVSVAEQLVQAGVPAVVANQMPITLSSVALFCGALYTSLLQRGNIDWAVNEGRIAVGVEFTSTNVAAVEWGVPVLYRRPGCSDLFSVGAGA